MNAKVLIKRLRAAGHEVRSYSGRGMYGRECVGVSLSRGERLTVGHRTASYDALGLGSIAYWPSAVWPEGMVDSDSEEAS
jgi:hypothetical protein